LRVDAAKMFDDAPDEVLVAEAKSGITAPEAGYGIEPRIVPCDIGVVVTYRLREGQGQEPEESPQ
jgi:hypothetical protein